MDPVLKTFNLKHNIQIAGWNVWTLLETGKLRQVINKMNNRTKIAGESKV
jgi:hypothetical protein